MFGSFVDVADALEPRPSKIASTIIASFSTFSFDVPM